MSACVALYRNITHVLLNKLTPYIALYDMSTCAILFPGADPEGGAPGERPPKIGKNMIFWRKIMIFLA